ncbi:Hypothetical predicted protein [Cloeon dipterum]|nr:Hypothetical predicted protein [Cloeon dipterum]
MYLKDRVPLPINYNPILVLVNDPKPGYNDQVIRATNMLISSLRILKSLRAGILAPEVFHLNPKKSDTDLFYTVTGLLPSSVSWYGAYLFKAFPLDMSQYGNLFNSTRVPCVGKDKIVKNDKANHMLVMRNGNFYVFDALDKNGNILPPSDLLACIDYITKDASAASEFPIGVLTSENRDVWAKARQELEAQGNAEVLNIIDSSIFNLSLDDEAVGSNREKLLRSYLHSDGANRWFDKSFSLIIGKDGTAGINFEHSWGDGVAVLRYFTDMFKDSTNKPQVHPDTKSNFDAANHVRKLEFKLNDSIKKSIAEAKRKHAEISKSLAFDVLEMHNYGKKLCKKHGVSPDSIMQLGFQVGYHKLSGKNVATYESCSTAAFRHGRTETMRPCTMATQAVCNAINGSNQPSNAELLTMIKKCSEVHGNLTKDAAMGQGFDRHLFGLRRLAEQKGALPAIFSDPAYAAINHNILSTSTLSSDIVMAGAFGPVVKDGLGIGYSIMNDMLGAIVSSYPPNNNGAGFVSALKTAYENIFNVLETSNNCNKTRHCSRRIGSNNYFISEPFVSQGFRIMPLIIWLVIVMFILQTTNPSVFKIISTKSKYPPLRPVIDTPLKVIIQRETIVKCCSNSRCRTSNNMSTPLSSTRGVLIKTSSIAEKTIKGSAVTSTAAQDLIPMTALSFDSSTSSTETTSISTIAMPTTTITTTTPTSTTTTTPTTTPTKRCNGVLDRTCRPKTACTIDSNLASQLQMSGAST